MRRFLSNRKYVRVIGIGLICLSLVLAGVWFFLLSPYASLDEPLWRARVSKAEHWKETQKLIHRFGWSHDDSSPVGDYGDKRWAEWIMTKVEAGESITGCDNGHKDVALKMITCADPVDGTARTA